MAISIRFFGLCSAIFANSILLSSCKKDSPPQASIYVLDQSLNPVTGIGVHFFTRDPNTKTTGIDTTIITDTNGAANLTLKEEAYLDVDLKYLNAENKYASAETNAKFIKNEHFVDTLILKY